MWPPTNHSILEAAAGDLTSPYRSPANLSRASGRLGDDHIPFDKRENLSFSWCEIHFEHIQKINARRGYVPRSQVLRGEAPTVFVG
jgi:hypothetical protein